MDTGTACRGSGSGRHNISDRKSGACTLYHNAERVGGGLRRLRRERQTKSSHLRGFLEAAGEGFEPSLTDPESRLGCFDPY
jgi:hypothetical protein